MPRLRLIVYDLDGTLVDTGPNIALAINGTRAFYDLPELPVETVVSYVGDGAGKLVERAIFGQTNPGDIDPSPVLTPDAPHRPKEVYEQFMTIYGADPVALSTPYPGVMDALKWWHEQGVPQAVLTNKPHALAVECLKAHRMMPYLTTTIGRGCIVDGAPMETKPNPRGLLYLMNAHSTVANETCMVGDGQADLGVARATGSHAIILTSGFCSAARYAAMDNPPANTYASFQAGDAAMRAHYLND